MFVITAEFRIKSDRIEDFRKLIAWQAGRSVAEEPGCLQFDVCQDPEKPEVFLLYEVYTDAKAFDEGHINITRFREFSAKAGEMTTAGPEITRYTRVFTFAE